MKPLSPFKYIKGNRKKVIPIIIAVSLGVFLVYFYSLIQGQMLSILNSSREAFKQLAIVMPSNGNMISAKTIKEFKENKNYEKIIPGGICRYGTHITTIIGSTGIGAIYLNNSNMDYLMSELKVKLIDGRKPIDGKNEIMINRRIALNKNLKLYDKLGSEVDDTDNLQGSYTIVGIFDGPFLGLIMPMNPKIQNMDEPLKAGVLIFPKDGFVNEISETLDKLSPEEVNVFTLKSQKESLKHIISMLSSITGIMCITIIIVLCISLGNISYMNFYQRRREFGVLAAIGYTNGKLYRKIFVEMSILCALGYICGILLSLITGWMLNSALWAPVGKEMSLWNPSGALFTIMIPLFVTIFSIIPALKTFKKTDPVLVIEGTV